MTRISSYAHSQTLLSHMLRNQQDMLVANEKVSTGKKAGDFKERPIVVIEDDGRVDLNFNYYCADPNQDADALALNQDFLDFVMERMPGDMVLSIGLQPGEVRIGSV